MNIQAIYPPLPLRTMPNACTSCRKDVRSDRGFVDLDGPAWGAYLCASCGNLSLPRAGLAADLIQRAQDRYRASLSK